MKPNYRINIDWSDEDKCFVARVPELDGVVTHGETYADAATNAEEAIALHLESLAAHGDKIPTPMSSKKLSGKILGRVGAFRHATLLMEADRQEISMNELLNRMIDDLPSSRAAVVRIGSARSNLGVAKARTTRENFQSSKKKVKSRGAR